MNSGYVGCNYRVYDKDGKLLGNFENAACFSQGNNTVNVNKVVVKLLNNKNEDITKEYIDFLNKFITGLEYDEKENTVTFEYKNRIYYLACGTALRLLWGDRVDDKSELVPKKALELFKEYELNEASSFAIAHLEMPYISSSHQIFSTINVYGVKRTTVGIIESNEAFIDAIVNPIGINLNKAIENLTKNTRKYKLIKRIK